MIKWTRQGYTASCARHFRNLLRSIFFSECFNVIGEGELTTSLGSLCIPNANAPTNKHVRQIVISRNGHNKFKMITSGRVRVNRKFKNFFALNTDKSHFAESHFAESHFADSQFAESHFAESHFAESRLDKSHYGWRFQGRDHQLFCNFDFYFASCNRMGTRPKYIIII